MKERNALLQEQLLEEGKLDSNIAIEANNVANSTPNTSPTTTRNEAIRLFAKIALPFSLTRFMGITSEFFGSILLANLSKEHLAACGLITVSNNLFLVNSAASVFSTSILQSQSLKAKKPAEIDEIFKASLIYASILGSINSVPLYFSRDLMSKAFNQHAQVSDIVSEYFTAFILSGGPTAFLTSVSFQQTAYALGQANTVLLVNVARRALYLALSYGLVKGELGMPKLEAAGLAYANSISTWLDILLFVGLFKFKKEFKEYDLLNTQIKSSFKHLKVLSQKSLLIAAQTFNDFLVSFANTVITGSRDLTQLSALEIANQYSTIVSIPILCAGQATSIIMGQRGVNSAAARSILQASLLSTLAIPLLTIPVLTSIPKLLSQPFVGNTEDHNDLDTMIRDLLIIVAVSELPSVFRNILGGSLRGKGNYKAAALASLIGMTLIGFPAGLALSYFADMGVIGLQIGSLIGSILGSTILMKNVYSDILQDKSQAAPIANDSNFTTNRYAQNRNTLWNGSASATIKTKEVTQSIPRSNTM